MIKPFWVGVAATILAETLALIVLLKITGKKTKDRWHK